jgi:hypothetical protein
MRTKRHLGLLALAGSVGCSGGALDDGRHPTGSQAIVASSSFSALYVANPDDDTVIRYSPSDGSTIRRTVGREPTRIARVKDRLFVTLRAERAVAIVNDTGTTLEVEDEIAIGAEPYGIVATEDGARVYVAASLAGQVLEIDPVRKTIRRSWTVEDEPRWLALRPDGGSLYVGSAYHGRLSRIDLTVDPGVAERLEMPEIQGGFDGPPADGTNGKPSFLTVRLTGDPAVTPDGSRLVIPAIYVDNTAVVMEPSNPKTLVSNPNGTSDPNGSGTFQGGGGYSPGRFNPVVVAANLDRDGRFEAKGQPVIRVASPVPGYPSNVAISPDSKTAYVSIEGGGSVVAMTLDAPSNNGGILDALFGDHNMPPASFAFRSTTSIGTSAGPRAFAVINGQQGFAYAFIDHHLDEIDLGQVDKSLHPEGGGVNSGESFGGDGPAGAQRTIVFPINAKSHAIADETFPSDVARGRRLFYATDNPVMSGTGVGVSCATCHFEGRTDGLTWQFQRGGRQTPSLAGKVSLTQPVRWEGDRPTVADDAFETSQNLMGGNGLSADDANAIQAFIDHGRDVDVPLKGSTDDPVLRGKAIFERAEVGCSGCHNGPRFTNNTVVSMFGLDQVKVRSLVGVFATPPYLHDGSAPTLDSLVARVRDGEMGNTSSLSESEMSDLVTYLQSL